MGEPELELARRMVEDFNATSGFGPLRSPEIYADDLEIVPIRAELEGISFRGPTALDEFFASTRQMWVEQRLDLPDVEEIGPGALLMSGTYRSTGRGSGVSTELRIWTLVRIRGGQIREIGVYTSDDKARESLRRGVAERRATRQRRLERARLYFVCEARPRGDDPAALLEAALRGGADLIQLRDKGLDDRGLIDAARPFRAAADAHGALFVLNDRPDLVATCDADGVHVGEEDVSVTEARRLAGGDALVGLSTHTPDEVDAAFAAGGDERPDQVSVGPVWATPTKEGRPATGLGLIEHAARAGTELTWFAIGGIDRTNVADVAAAGARRIVVVRAIRDAHDPEAAARELRAALD